MFVQPGALLRGGSLKGLADAKPLIDNQSGRFGDQRARTLAWFTTAQKSSCEGSGVTPGEELLPLALISSGAFSVRNISMNKDHNVAITQKFS